MEFLQRSAPWPSLLDRPGRRAAVAAAAELASISDTARTVDRSTMPALERFQARDGTTLAYRHYPARGRRSD